ACGDRGAPQRARPQKKQWKPGKRRGKGGSWGFATRREPQFWGGRDQGFGAATFAEQTTCAARANSLGQQLLARPVQSNEQVFFADRKPAANLVAALVLQHAQVHHVAQPGRQGGDSRQRGGEELALLGEPVRTRLRALD